MSKKREPKFNGDRGKYNTLCNEVVRQLGEKEAKSLRNQKEIYAEMSMVVSNLANDEEEQILYPKGKVPAFYGMKDEIKEQLDSTSSSRVNAYLSTWLTPLVKFILKGGRRIT